MTPIQSKPIDLNGLRSYGPSSDICYEMEGTFSARVTFVSGESEFNSRKPKHSRSHAALYTAGEGFKSEVIAK